MSDAQPVFVVAAVVEALVQRESEARENALFAKWVQSTRGDTRAAIAQWASRVEGYADRMPALCLQSAAVMDAQDCLPLFGSATRHAQALASAADGRRVAKRDALRILAKANDESVLDWVLGVLDSPDVSVAVAACEALDHILDDRGLGHALEPLQLVLMRLTNSVEGRRAVIRAIGKTRSTRAWVVLEPLLASQRAQQEELLAAIEAVAYVAHARRGEHRAPLGRVAGRSQRNVWQILCPLVDHRASGMREAAMLGLYAAGQRCEGGSLQARLLDDPVERVRIAAARVLTLELWGGPSREDGIALRWCQAFEPSKSVRALCMRQGRSVGMDQEGLAGATLLFATPEQVKHGIVAAMAVGFLRSVGLVRYANLDRRGALFEPDSACCGTRLLAPIAGDS